MKTELADYLNDETDKLKTAQKAEGAAQPKVKRLVRWTATYETVIEVAEGEDERAIAAEIDVDVPGSEYQTDTWEVDEITDVAPEEIAENESSRD